MMLRRLAIIDADDIADIAMSTRAGRVQRDSLRAPTVFFKSGARDGHEFAVRSGCGDVTGRLEGAPSAANLKTSLMADSSLTRELLNRADTVVI